MGLRSQNRWTVVDSCRSRSVERWPLPGAATSLYAARVVDEDPAHFPCGDGKEMSPALPEEMALIDQFEINLVHQARGVKDVVGALAVEQPLPVEQPFGYRVQLLVDERNELLERLVVSPAPGQKQLVDVFLGCHGSWVKRRNENPYKPRRFEQHTRNIYTQYAP